MFGLLKLLAYGLLGYAIYEFIRGMSATEAQGSFGGGGWSSSGNLRGDAGRANLTGRGGGMDVESQEEDGGSVRHTVGRGVVS